MFGRPVAVQANRNSTKMVPDFQNKLIDLVRANECLYNVYSDDYRKVALRKKIWKSISLNLNTPVRTCRMTWRNIRYMYLREKREGWPEVDPTKRRRKYSRDLSFLLNGLPPESYMSNMYEAPKPDLHMLDSVVIKKTESSDEFDDIIDLSKDEEIDGIPLDPDEDEEEIFALPALERVSVDDISWEDRLNGTMEQLQQTCDYLLSKEAHDPVELYCLSLAGSLRAMDHQERERVKMEFSKILKDAKYCQ